MLNELTKNEFYQKKGLKKSPSTQFLEKIILGVKPVSRVTKGGRKRRFVALVLVKREKSIAFSYSRGKDVATAIKKATKAASEKLTTYFEDTPHTIPRDLKHSFNATEIRFRPASAGSGLIAGGAVNLIFKCLGIQDMSAKIIGSRNKMNVVKCVFEALDKFWPKRRKRTK